jgi:spermidine dehydrogenase
MRDEDDKLGMNRPITRRDFLDGVAVGVGGAMVLPHLPAWQESDYPPARTGLRGSHVGSYETLHQLRDGRFWNRAAPPQETGEEYDLVVVGAGISGLAAAHYFRQARPDARVLLLDNHDDFGGHAKRNEFQAGGRTRIGYGGTQSIDSPAPYSPVSKALISELGIDVGRWTTALDGGLYSSLGLQRGFFFDKETFGTDKLVIGSQWQLTPDFIANAPVSAEVRRDLERLRVGPPDPMPGVDQTEKKVRLSRISYADFLTRTLGLDPGVVPVFRTSVVDLFGVGIDAVPARDAFGLGLPGFQKMGMDSTPSPGQNYDSIISPESESYYFHFPDGNASIARLLVRRLIPDAIPGSTMDDIVTARADYGRLDRQGAPVRLRLSSPVVRVRHLGDPATATQVEVTYVQGGTPKKVTGRSAVLACWHTVIPYLCDEFPPAQQEALAFAVKVPLVYTNVFIRSWSAFQKLGVSRIVTPGLWHTAVSLDFPVSMKGYDHPRRPDEPIVLHLSTAARKAGLPVRDQHREGRIQLFQTSFETIERRIRRDLGRVLGPGGFDPAEDILGITVNRWPHGYAYQYNSLYDDFWVNGGEQPCAVARRPLGRIAIANADAGAYSYTDAAIDHGYRAVQEILRGR